MEIKDAIKFLRNHFRIGIYEKKSKDIIALLKQLNKKAKRGEVYEAMWEELFMEKGMFLILQDDGYSKLLYKILEDLEQKYFPKEIIEEVVKGITEQIKEGAGIAKKERD
uniref:Uncharacterized protein n=2 Tax=viral metagenome TaxID=1070528 RepID=A0A6H1ZVC0_9ZZZZ